VEDHVDRFVELDVLGHVLVDELEVLVPDVLDVLERARVQVVDAHDTVPFRKQEIAQVRAQKARTAGDDSDRH